MNIQGPLLLLGVTATTGVGLGTVAINSGAVNIDDVSGLLAETVAAVSGTTAGQGIPLAAPAAPGTTAAGGNVVYTTQDSIFASSVDGAVVEEHGTTGGSITSHEPGTSTGGTTNAGTGTSPGTNHGTTSGSTTGTSTGTGTNSGGTTNAGTGTSAGTNHGTTSGSTSGSTSTGGSTTGTNNHDDDDDEDEDEHEDEHEEDDD